MWDKDDEPALDFVMTVSNLRSICFHIERNIEIRREIHGRQLHTGLMVLQLNLLRRLTKLTEQKSSKKEIAELFKAAV